MYELKMAAIRVYESVFSGDQASLVDKYNAEDRYVGSLVGVRYAEAFRARSPLLVALHKRCGNVSKIRPSADFLRRTQSQVSSA